MGYKNLHHKEASKKPLKVSTGFADWKEMNDGGIEAVGHALKEHGLHIHQGNANDDSTVFHIANRPMTKAEIKKHDKAIYEDD